MPFPDQNRTCHARCRSTPPQGNDRGREAPLVPHPPPPTVGTSVPHAVELKSYIVDFCCLKERLVIELDGGQHAEITEYELERRAWLEANGYRVLRFWNKEVFENLEGVLETIVRALKAPKIEL